MIFGRRGPGGGEVFGSRAIPQATPRTSETPNTSPPPGPCRGTKKRPCARWIRMPDRGSLWLLPSGPDQIRNMSSSEPIERARRSVYLTRSRPAGQEGANPSDGFAPLVHIASGACGTGPRRPRRPARRCRPWPRGPPPAGCGRRCRACRPWSRRRSRRCRSRYRSRRPNRRPA